MFVILTEAINTSAVEGPRTAAELARCPGDQRDEGSSSRQRSRCISPPPTQRFHWNHSQLPDDLL